MNSQRSHKGGTTPLTKPKKKIESQGQSSTMRPKSRESSPCSHCMCKSKSKASLKKISQPEFSVVDVDINTCRNASVGKVSQGLANKSKSTGVISRSKPTVTMTTAVSPKTNVRPDFSTPSPSPKRTLTPTLRSVAPTQPKPKVKVDQPPRWITSTSKPKEIIPRLAESFSRPKASPPPRPRSKSKPKSHMATPPRSPATRIPKPTSLKSIRPGPYTNYVQEKYLVPWPEPQQVESEKEFDEVEGSYLSPLSPRARSAQFGRSSDTTDPSNHGHGFLIAPRNEIAPSSHNYFTVMGRVKRSFDTDMPLIPVTCHISSNEKTNDDSGNLPAMMNDQGHEIDTGVVVTTCQNEPVTPITDSNLKSSTMNRTSTAIVKNTCAIWPLIEAFEFGCLPTYPCAMLSPPLLNKIMIYTRTKGYFPSMTLKNWMHICHYKLKFNLDYAWMYIRMFDIIYQQGNRVDKKDKDLKYWDKRCDRIRQTKSDSKKTFSVPTLEFLLFLYIQHFYRTMTKCRMRKSAGAEEEDEEKFAKLEESNEFVLGEGEQVEFIKSYIEDMIKFLQLSDGSLTRVSAEIVSSLNLIMTGVVYGKNGADLWRLEKFLAFEDVQKKVDLNPSDNTVDDKCFVAWITQTLKYFEVGSLSCFKRGQSQLISIGYCMTNKCNDWNDSIRRIGWNEQKSPHGWFVVSQANSQTLCKDDLPPFTSLKIHRCNNAHIYIPECFTNVCVEECEETKIYLGCVAKVLKVTNCNELDLVAQGREIIIHDCLDCKFSLHTPSPIILAGQCTARLVFGPYATFYPKLQEHMDLAHLGPEPSHWSTVIGVPEPSGTPMETESRWTVLDPTKCTEYIYPFEMDGKTKSNPIIFPIEYMEYKQKMKERFRSLQKQMEGLTEAQRKINKETMYEHFKLFLEENEFDIELDELKSMIPGNIKSTLSPEALDDDHNVKNQHCRNSRDAETNIVFESEDFEDESSAEKDAGDDETDIFTNSEDSDCVVCESSDWIVKKQFADFLFRPVTATDEENENEIERDDNSLDAIDTPDI